MQRDSRNITFTSRIVIANYTTQYYFTNIGSLIFLTHCVVFLLLLCQKEQGSFLYVHLRRRSAHEDSLVCLYARLVPKYVYYIRFVEEQPTGLCSRGRISLRTLRRKSRLVEARQPPLSVSREQSGFADLISLNKQLYYICTIVCSSGHMPKVNGEKRINIYLYSISAAAVAKKTTIQVSKVLKLDY